jgi:hypothetical protein
MLDIDTKREDQLTSAHEKMVTAKIIEKVETENGWHYITEPFNTQNVCELGYVSLIRDGYVYVKSIHTDSLNK